MIHRPGNTEFISIVLKIRHSIQGSKHDSYSKIYFTASENTKTHQVYAKVSKYQPWLWLTSFVEWLANWDDPRPYKPIEYNKNPFIL